MLISDDMAENGVRLCFDGAVDAVEASRFHEALQALAQRSHVILDLRYARRIDDYALSLMAPDLASLEGRLTILGLGQHQRRMLGYLGIPELARGGRADAE